MPGESACNAPSPTAANSNSSLLAVLRRFVVMSAPYGLTSRGLGWAATDAVGTDVGPALSDKSKWKPDERTSVSLPPVAVA